MSIADDLCKAHDDLIEAVKGLKTAELDRPGAIGDWSIRDVMLHIAMWNGEALKALAIWRAGSKIDWSYVGNHACILKFNDFWVGALKHLSAMKILKLYDTIHTAMLADVSGISDDQWKKRGGVPKWLDEIVLSHTDHHAQKIREYRKASGK